MSQRSYRQAGLVLVRGGATATRQQVKDLQHDLRALGYLNAGVDGNFGPTTEKAVRRLQCDLLLNDGRSTADDGKAPVSVLDYNRGRVVLVNGVVDQALAVCMSDMLDDPTFPTLPSAPDPAGENKRALDKINAIQTKDAPVPFLLAIFKQESGLRHFNEPPPGDDDTFITLGSDTNSSNTDRITSRGYGLGQYTIFHHPPVQAEIEDFMLDPARNIEKGSGELREKFDGFVNGQTSGTMASDRRAELGPGPLKICKYEVNDSRYLTDCRKCARDAGVVDIEVGVTPLFPGSADKYLPTQYYEEASHQGVPDRSRFGCDWPYAMRRYNGAGVNSYHYQAIVLKNLLLI